jgi:two-component system, chemotaxis family, protein-glutamate methylesterase/glutaminase
MAKRRQSISKQRSSAPSHPIEITCPDCAGVLSIEVIPVDSHQSYRCQVGHRYSTRSLIEAKEDAVERTLWSAVSFLIHIEQMYAQMLDELKSCNGSARRHLQLRMKEARQQQHIITDLIHETHSWDG